MTTAVCIGIGLAVVAGVWVVVLALCRQAAFNDRPLTEREVAMAQRPRGGVEHQGVVAGENGLPRLDLDALDRAHARDLGAGS